MMHDAWARPMVCLLATAALTLAAGAAADPGPARAFGAALATDWDGVELACPDDSYAWFGATPETLYCFRVEMSGVAIRAELNRQLEEQGVWLSPWKQETPELTSRPYFWGSDALFRIVVGTSFAAPHLAVVFVRHAAID